MNDPDGIINLFKPTGITSAKALYRVRRITSIRKSGHAGTLDPAADGVLLICQGKATKLVERLMTLPKVYRATARLDVTSESFDSDRPLIPVRINQMPDDNKVRGAFSGFEGKIEQTPPRISAIKLNGVPAYRTAGQADAPPISPRTVHIHWIQLRRYDWPTVYFDVACGRGTYIRALIRDIGTQLATGGCLTGLQRTAVGPFNVDNAWSFDRLPSAAMHEYLIPLDRVSKILNEESNVIPQRPQTCQFI